MWEQLIKELDNVLSHLEQEKTKVFQAAILEEREACAKIAEIHLNQSGYMGGMSGTILQNSTAREIAQAIRARGKQEADKWK